MTRRRYRNTDRRPRTHRIPAFEPLEGRQLMAAGDLDPSFGAGGKSSLNFIGVKGNAQDVAVQADGKTVVAGYTWYYDSKLNAHSQLAVARFNVNGVLDKTFGPDGDGVIETQVADRDSARGRAVAIQPDAKILVAGWARSGGDDVMIVVRYNTDGSLDNTFDKDGKVTVRINDSAGYDMALQNDGKIVVAGADFDGSDNFAAIRLNPNGSLDKSFDGDGKATVKMGAGEWAKAVAIDYSGTPQSNSNYGKIVLAGIYKTETFEQYAIARLNTNGKLDTGFAFGGWRRGGFNGHIQSRANSVVVQPNGKYVIAGTGGEPQAGKENSYQFALARFDARGAIDTIFGTNGIVETGFAKGAEAHDVILSADDGLLVGGEVNRKLALAKYNSIGQLDPRFGTGGKVVLDTGDIDAGAGLASTGDGRFVFAGGYNFTTVRLLQGMPTVDIINGDREGTETYGDNGSLIITRDDTYEFPTRVYLKLSGDLTCGVDYATSLTLVPGNNNLAYVDIPAGQRQVYVPINSIDDNLLEPAETGTFTLATNEGYTIGSFKDRTVTIADNDSLSINFAPPAPPDFKVLRDTADYGVDIGQKFGQHGKFVFGWDADNTANARRRNSAGSPDARYDTFNHMQKAGASRKWEIALPNGLYTVRLVAGDPSAADSVYRMSLEGQRVLVGTPGGDVRWFRSTTNVLVTDGRLTLSNAAGAKNNKIAFIDIQGAGIRAKAGPVTASLPVRLYGPATLNNWHSKPNGTRADDQIDEPLWP
jgi:uncharacterized delta-60 repeat protein